MPRERVFDDALDGVANGLPINWDLFDGLASDQNERERLKWLRVLGEIADLHRSDHESLDGSAQGSIDADVDRAEGLDPTQAETWGRFHLRQKVGEGSFGSVYRAWDPQLEREIAIKILHGHIADTAVTARLLREGRALAKIRHANVVSVLGVEAHGGQIGLCMDFVHGQTLEDVLRTQGTFSAGEAVLIGQDLCRALVAVHRTGMVHRDVKARNVMREQAGRVVLMDFGTGRDARALEVAHGPDIGGTPLYMAPEVLDGQPASPCSDVYSLGVLLYHLVTGEYPVEAATLDALGAAHREGRRRFVSEARADLTPGFVRVVERALASDPEGRYPNAGALLNALGVVSEIESTTRSTLPPIVIAAAAAVSAAAGTLAFGFLTSGAFNVTLERSDFAAETMWDWWLWGLRAHVGPAFLLTLGCLATALFAVVARLACGVSSSAARLGESAGRKARRWAHRLSLDQAPVLGSWVLLLSSGGLVAAWWYFSPLIVALCTKISMAPADSHALLSPAFERYQDRYWQTLSSLIILAGFGWYTAARVAAAGGQSMHRGMIAGGAAVMILALASLDFPYRLIVHNKFEAANWNGAKCYIIGERVDDALLFCPELQPPRNRVIQKSTGDLQRLGRRENIFTRARDPLPGQSRASMQP